MSTQTINAANINISNNYIHIRLLIILLQSCRRKAKILELLFDTKKTTYNNEINL